MLDNECFDLPDGIIEFEILLRLPVKSLGRFKCVCKHWYDVIESRDFREQHFALANNSALVISGNYSSDGCYYEGKICSGKSLRDVESISIPVLSSHTIGPCRGLFLICGGLNIGAHIGLLNPATKAFRLLPTPRMPNSNISDSDFTIYQLGWCPITDDYKVFCFIGCCRVALLYTLSSDSWRLLDFPNTKLGGIMYNRHQSKIHISGFCYWLPFPIQQPSSVLVSFDVTREICMTISVHPNMIKKICTLSSYYDSLALLAMKKVDVDVWILQQEGQQYCWTKTFNFTHTLQDQVTKLCGIWNNTHILFLKRTLEPTGVELKSYDVELMAYDMKNLEKKVMNTDHVEKVMDSCIFSFLNYKKGMFSIEGGSQNWTVSQSYNHIHEFLTNRYMSRASTRGRPSRTTPPNFQ